MRIVLVVLSVLLIAGCDSGGSGKIEPLTGLGPPAKKTASGGGPHPMPSGQSTTGG